MCERPNAWQMHGTRSYLCKHAAGKETHSLNVSGYFQRCGQSLCGAWLWQPRNNIHTRAPAVPSQQAVHLQLLPSPGYICMHAYTLHMPRPELGPFGLVARP
jgi:hypothetical protein